MNSTFTADDQRHMAHALRLAAHGLYSTDPNPRVGCVIVSDGVVVGEGWHAKAGEPHAESHALRAAGARARGATAYVTLEPCAHRGRTPPCADALIEAGIARVVYAVRDPFHAVNGAGAARLAAAGIATSEGCLRAPAEELNRGFFRRQRAGLPFVTVKLAATLDGRTALANGESRWITGEAARADVQRLRARSSAIVSGVASVRRDDARLTVRDPTLALRGRQPLRVVLDPRLELPPEAALLRAPGPVLLCHGAEPDASALDRAAALRSAGADLRALPSASGARGVDPAALLRHLAERHANEVLVEAGPRLAGAFLAARLVDELVVYLAPDLLGPDAQPLAVLPRIEALQDKAGFELRDVRRLGRDLKLVLVPAPVAG